MEMKYLIPIEEQKLNYGQIFYLFIKSQIVLYYKYTYCQFSGLDQATSQWLDGKNIMQQKHTIKNWDLKKYGKENLKENFITYKQQEIKIYTKSKH